MTALVGALGVLALLLGAACCLLVRRLEQLHAETLRHERAVNAERAVRVIELERMLDQVRAGAAGVVPPSGEELAQRVHAGRVELGGPKPAAGLPQAIQEELDQIEDPTARDEFAELAAHRMSQGEAPESIAQELFS